MTRRERERYTERSRPHRKDTPRGGGGRAAAGGSPWKNPVVMVAALGLVLAVVLAAGFLVGRERADGTLDAPPVAEAPELLEGAEPAADQPTEPLEAAPDGPDLQPPAGADTPTDGLWLPGDGQPYARPDDMALDPETTAYFASIETEGGTVIAELWPDLAPAHVNSFVFLAREGFFDGLTFHRVENWVVQGGDPTGTGSGGPGYRLPAEFNPEKPVNHRYGTLAMARSQEFDSGGSQFYFIKDPEGAAFLDGQYTVFGHVIEGMDVVRALSKDAVMTRVTIEERPRAERVVGPDQIRAGDLPEPPGGGAD